MAIGVDVKGEHTAISGTGPLSVTPSISAPWNSPFAVGSGATASGSQNDPTGGNVSNPLLLLGVISAAAAVISLLLTIRRSK